MAGVVAIIWLGPLMLAGVVMLGARVALDPRALLDRALAGVGRRSYSLYLTHAIALTGIAGLLVSSSLTPLEQATLELGGSALLCASFFHWVERPCLLASRRAKDQGAGISCSRLKSSHP